MRFVIFALLFCLLAGTTLAGQCFTVQCASGGEPCTGDSLEDCAENTPTGVCILCRAGTQCNGGVCQILIPQGDGPCDHDSQCDRTEYDTSCVNRICGGKDVFYPGEECDIKDQSLEDGGCIGHDGITCEANGQCSFIAEGGNCDGKEDWCQGGFYCDKDTHLCTAWRQQGASCKGDEYCEPHLYCHHSGSGGTISCSVPYAVGVGQTCDSYFDCKQGLWCDSNSKTCVEPDKEVIGKKCDNHTNCSPNTGVLCACDPDQGEEVCQAITKPLSFLSSIYEYQKCLTNNKCHRNELPYPDNCAEACSEAWRAANLAVLGTNPCSATGVAVSMALLFFAAALALI